MRAGASVQTKDTYCEYTVLKVIRTRGVYIFLGGKYMTKLVTKKQVMRLIGKQIIAVKKDGSQVTGKLLRVSGNRLILQRVSGKKVQTKAIIPLVLFDLLAIGTAPYAYGGGVPYGGGYGYGAPYGGYGYGGTPYPPYGFF